MAPVSKRRRFLRYTLPACIAWIGFFLLPRILPPTSAAYVQVAVLAIAAILFAFEVRSYLRSYRKLKEVRAGGRWPLGVSYGVQIDEHCDGRRHDRLLEIDESSMTFDVGNPTSLPLADVVAIRVRATWIEIETAAHRIRIIPRSYADRERLLWELAVRRSDAFEFADDSAPPTFAYASTSISATDDVSDLDHRMTGSGLASALAGPATLPNPAPPRRSGLGVGLFPPPPGE